VTSDLVDRLLAGEERALSRAITLVENESKGFERLLRAVHDRLGRARRLGITGPPGAGKSTLVAALAKLWLDRGLTVGVIAVDPTSPFTGGALLGDRVRMNELATARGAFIRSMASRGSTGGLATATGEAADLMDAFGFERIILETLGVGQSELAIAGSADSTTVVLVPESGDSIQAMKAGLMEVADLFVINKADRPGADRLDKEIEVMMAIRKGNALRGIPSHHHGVRVALRPEPEPPADEAAGWEVPVLQTVASTGQGVEELAVALDEHFEQLEKSGSLEERRAANRLERVRAVLSRRVESDAARIWAEQRDGVRAKLEAGASPYEVADLLHDRLVRHLLEDG